MPSIAFTEPDMTYHDSSDDSMRRLSNDFGRHKLTDLLEADESEEDLDYLKSARRNRYTSIGSTASSIDGLWELHPRRLSEAGLSRHSDSSAVLTEDTDSFMIGQRVWVGGTKPGTIAYIGETQFAPGEWAGIALDEPIGKNDGSVGGTRYFQCENKKGVFSRLTRLTRVPLEQPGMGSNETFISPNGVRRSPISPTGSTSGLLRSSVSLSNSNTSLASTATHVDFKIGDRVIIKSTQGSKIGTVRYMGLTDFAPGEWVGVELDDPRGKNDGSVEGTRYFECRPNFGLFAPISKVSKSPSKHKPSACVVHSGSGLPPSGLKRANSKESMTSLASRNSVASSVRRVRLGVTSLTPKKVSPKTSTPIPTRTALQDVLREKQQHIEQLLKERDLERAEITRAASQADEAEHRFYTLKQEFEKYRAECESKIQENSEVLSELKVDRAELLSQLEDEKRRNEDLQFRFEEAAITKSDVEVVNENYVKRIGQLEADLAEERQKTEALESTSNKLFEAEESLIKVREEIENLKAELGKSRQSRSTLEEEGVLSAQLVESLKKQIEGAGLENEEKTKTINRLNEEMSKIASEHEIVKRKVGDCNEKDELIKKLKEELDHEKKIIEKYAKTHADLIKENEKLKMELSAKSLDVETANEEVASKNTEIKSIRNELETVKKELAHKEADMERHKTNSKDIEEHLRKEIDQTREDLKSKISEVENVKKECNIKISQKEQQLQEVNKTLSQNNEEIKKLNDELASAKTSFEDSKTEIHSRHARQVASQDSQLMALSAELQQKNEEITKSSIVISKLEEDLCTKNGIIEKLRLELESNQSQQSTHSETSKSLTKQVNEFSVINGDLQRQLAASNERINSLLEVKQHLENEIQTLSARCENADQIEHFRGQIQTKTNLLESLKLEYEDKLRSAEKMKHEVELQYQTAVANFERIRTELEQKLQTSMKAEELLSHRCQNSISEMAQVRDEYRVKINEMEAQLQEKQFALANIEGKLSETARHYEQQMQTVTAELNRNLHGCQKSINLLNEEKLQLKEQLTRQTEELIEIQAKGSHILAQTQQTEKELKQKYSEDIKRLEFELNEKSLQIEKTMSELQLVRNDCYSTSTDLSAKDHKIGELTVEVQQAQTLISQLQEQLNTITISNKKSSEQHELVENQCRSLLEQVATLTEQVRSGETVFKNLQIEHQNAIQLVNHLKITEQQKQQCLLQLQNEATISAEKQNCQHVIELLNQVKIDNTTENSEKLLSLHRDIEIIRNELAERNHQFDLQKSELLRLQQELIRAQDFNARCKEGQNHENSIKTKCNNCLQLIQDKDLAENQIKFLNSIIVDIQRKNEEQRARIEILEAGCSPAVAQDLKLIAHVQRQIPPRVYCDICEEFDLHETEDCPKQNTDVAHPNGRGERIKSDRPYCEICEAFGHATEDCQEDETF